MKNIFILLTFLSITLQCKSQKAYDPCQKLDTNTIKRLIIGTWVEVKDTSHVLVITDDSLEESIVIMEGVIKKLNVSYWNYKFTDNIFSSDDVTCYSLYEYKEGYGNHITTAINGLDEHFLLLGASGKTAFKRRE